MTEAEMTYLIGELASTEINDVNRVEYKNEILIIIMENGKRFLVEIKEHHS